MTTPQEPKDWEGIIRSAQKNHDCYTECHKCTQERIDFIKGLLSLQKQEFVEMIEELHEKKGFMPLGKSDDPWNKALDAILSKLKQKNIQ